jgi:hypothetical protein
MRKTNLRRVFSAFLVLSFMLTQSGIVVPGVGTSEVRAAVSIDELTDLINTAQFFKRRLTPLKPQRHTMKAQAMKMP